MELFAPALSKLPDAYQAMNAPDRAKVQLKLKAADTEQYQLLRAQAIRCAR